MGVGELAHLGWEKGLGFHAWAWGCWPTWLGEGFRVSCVGVGVLAHLCWEKAMPLTILTVLTGESGFAACCCCCCCWGGMWTWQSLKGEGRSSSWRTGGQGGEGVM